MGIESKPLGQRITMMAALLIMLVTAPQLAAQTVMLDRVIAIVDGDVILSSEFQSRLDAVRESLAARGETMPDEAVLIQEVLDRMVLERIQLQIGERIGVRFSDAELNEAMSTIAAQNGVSLDQFRLQLEAQGKSYAAVREQVMQELVVNNVQQGSLRSRVQITKQDIDNYLRSDEGQTRTAASYEVSHLLLPLASDADSDDEEAAREYLETLRLQLLEPGKFDATIGAPPQAPYAVTAGNLGWRNASSLPSMFIDEVPKLEVGQVSAPIRSASGYHLVKLLDKRGGSGQLVDQTKARHILVMPSEIRSDAQAEELARSIRKRIIAGEDFAVLAREFSEDYGSAQEGGDLGWTNPGQMVPEFESVIQTAPLNEISEPVHSGYGWHIIEVLGRREQDISEEMRRNHARNIIYQERFQEELQLWLRKIRDEAFVEIKL